MVDMARAFLTRKAVENPRLEAELLVAHALRLERLGLFLRLDQPVVGAEVDRARDALVRRGRREPVAYITGAKEFYGRRFEVGAGCLVPRPETELLVDRARELAPQPRRILDVGTGSGCIGVTLALELAGAEVLAVDVSEDALAWARRNAEALGAAIELVHGEGLLALETRGPFDLVVSNPPYIEPEESAALAPEVREHEPLGALFAPAGDPDHWARELMRRVPEALTPGGALLVELGHRQAPRVLALATALGLDARIHDDLAGVPRVLEVTAAQKSEVRRT
ncbi:MAG: peptide chain release factor N(5)-glutamine methyltransferase [Planctomycetota bacterium]